MNRDSDGFVIIHGHFYQPPRENPWSGMIPKQISAAPFHDWNHRITAECYTANTSSRRLDAHGLIESIDNNYRRISFNIGPTLLAWLEQYAPETYQRIIEADKQSMERFGGHGNALAQGFNHSILPLASPEDMKIQIRWGIEDFQHRFGRFPEGMWLPETAINDTVVDQLIEEGIRFTVLSPFQGQAMKDKNSDQWIKLDHGAPCDRAFKIVRPKGELTVFFYHPGLASGISFQHYLRDADQLYKRFINQSSQQEGNLLSVATDGEIYGHHEAFGDMCLASLINKMESSKEINLTNWGEYLDRFPPDWEVKLHKGEDNRGSSWSCHHGVSRWYKDCHCSTGAQPGWNQKWRAPLRQAFEDLHHEIKQIYQNKASKLCKTSPAKMLLDYGNVIVGAVTREEFLKENLKESFQNEEGNKLLKLLEGQRFSQYMFTSCGWFFAELSGIEPIQNMKYAARAIELYQPYTQINLQRILSAQLKKAQGNISEKGSGWDLFIEEALTDSQHITQSVAYFVFLEIYGVNKLQKQESYHFHHLMINRNPGGSVEGSISLELNNTQESFRFNFHLEEQLKKRDILEIQEEKDPRIFKYDLSELPREIREIIYHKKRKEDLNDLKNYLAQSYQQLLNCFKDHQKILPEGDPLTKATLQSAITLAQAGILENAEDQGLILLDEEEVNKLDELFLLGNALRQQLGDYIVTLCSRIIADEVEFFLEYKNIDTIEMLYRFIKILWKHKLSAVKPYTQNLVYEVFNRKTALPWLKDFLKEKGLEKQEILLQVTDKLSEIANIRRDVMINAEDLQTILVHE